MKHAKYLMIGDFTNEKMEKPNNLYAICID